MNSFCKNGVENTCNDWKNWLVMWTDVCWIIYRALCPYHLSGCCVSGICQRVNEWAQKENKHHCQQNMADYFNGLLVNVSTKYRYREPKKVKNVCYSVRMQCTYVAWISDLWFSSYIHTLIRSVCTELFEMIVRVLTTCHLVLEMQPHVISFYGVTSRIRFMFLLFPQVSRNWRYESEPPLKPSPLTCGTNSIIVLMFV